jgi:hypothetical protein
MKRRTTLGIYEDVVAMLEAFERKDRKTYLALFPRDAATLAAYLGVSIDMLSGTASHLPDPQEHFRQMLADVKKINGPMPDVEEL